MKIFVYSDLHGSVSAMQAVVQAVTREAPQKVVFCGDFFGGGFPENIAQMAQSFDCPLYFVRGNNDRFGDLHFFGGGMEDDIPMYHFGRTLFFTHGHRYNGWNIPPVLGSGDAIIFGHTHVSSLTKRNGIFILNVGSVAVPRDGRACYLVLDNFGATLRTLEGVPIFCLPWTENR